MWLLTVSVFVIVTRIVIYNYNGRKHNRNKYKDKPTRLIICDLFIKNLIQK